MMPSLPRCEITESPRDTAAPKARGVIEVMMAHDHRRHLFAADERVGRVDARERGGGAAARLKHHQVVVELDNGAAVRAGTHVPHAFAECGDRRGRTSARAPLRRRGESGQLVRRDVDAIGVHLEHQRDLIAPVDAVHEAERQLDARERGVAGEVRRDRDFAEVLVRHDSARPLRQMRGGVERDPDRSTSVGRELHDRISALDRDGAERRFRIERLEERRQRMVEHVAAGLEHAVARPARAERRGEREHEGPALLVDGPFVAKVEHALRIRHAAPFRRCVHVAGDVAAAVEVELLAETGEREVFDALQALHAAHRFRGGLEQAFGRRRLRRGARRKRAQEHQRE